MTILVRWATERGSANHAVCSPSLGSPAQGRSEGCFSNEATKFLLLNKDRIDQARRWSRAGHHRKPAGLGIRADRRGLKWHGSTRVACREGLLESESGTAVSVAVNLLLPRHCRANGRRTHPQRLLTANLPRPLLNLFIQRSTLAALWEKARRKPPTVREGAMFQSRIGEWSYYLGCVSAALAIVYRALWFGSLGERLFGVPRIVPHHLMELTILLFVVSIASNARTMAHREEGKAAIRRVA